MVLLWSNTLGEMNVIYPKKFHKVKGLSYEKTLNVGIFTRMGLVLEIVFDWLILCYFAERAYMFEYYVAPEKEK